MKKTMFDQYPFSSEIVVTYYMTSKCNLCCSYCYEKGKEKTSDISLQRIISSIKALSEISQPIKAFFLFGGEPTIRCEECVFLLSEIAKYKNFGSSRKVLFTNGLFIDPSLRELILNKELEVFLSFDGFGEASRLRFGQNLNEGLKIINDDLESFKSVSDSITISFAIGAHNINTIESDIKRLHEIYDISHFKINIIRNKSFSAESEQITSVRERVMEWSENKKNRALMGRCQHVWFGI